MLSLRLMKEISVASTIINYSEGETVRVVNYITNEVLWEYTVPTPRFHYHHYRASKSLIMICSDKEHDPGIVFDQNGFTILQNGNRDSCPSKKFWVTIDEGTGNG